MAVTTSQLPAVVQITDLPTGTTITGAELLEAVQTVGGVAQSIQVPISQIMTTSLGGLPTGGATGQFLQKSNATNFASAWVNIASSVLASTGLAQSGSTAVSLSLASTAGLSVLGVGGTASAVPAAIAGTADQVFIVNHAGNTAGFGAVNLATSAAVTGVLPGANYSAVNLATTGAGGVQGLLPPASIATTGGAAGQLLIVSPTGTTPVFQGGVVLLNTLLPNNVASAVDTTSLTSAFRNYLVTLENIVPTTTTIPQFQVQVATSGMAFQNTSYIAITAGSIAAETSTTAVAISGAKATTGVANFTAYGLAGHFIITGASNSISRKMFHGLATWLTTAVSTTAGLVISNPYGYWDGANSPVTGLSFSFTQANIATGIIRIYGMA